MDNLAGVIRIAKKGVIMALAGAIFRIFEYWVVIPLAMLVVSTLRYNSFKETSIFLILWILSMVYAIAVILVDNNNPKADFTWTRSYRVTVEFVLRRSLLVGHLVECIYIIGITLWAGAGSLTIFFERKIKSVEIKTLIFFLSSGIQMWLWTKVYIYGYDDLVPLIINSIKDVLK